MSRFSWYEVTVLLAGATVTFPEYAADEQEAIANFKSRDTESEQAEVVKVALEPQRPVASPLR